MSDTLTHALLETMLTSRRMIAIEQSQESVRDNGPHAHAAGQMLGSASGLLSVDTGQSNWVVPATHCVWIPPRQVHAVRSHGPFSGWGLYIAEAACSVLPDSPCTMRSSRFLLEAVHRLAALPLTRPFERQERLAGVILDEIDILPFEQLGLAMPSEPRLQRIANALIADLSDKRGLTDWAEWASIPERTLSRRFVTETGFTFTAWRQRARILRALEMLAQGDAVTTVALDLGYDNIGDFIALFRRTCGVTPGHYARTAELQLEGGF